MSVVVDLTELDQVLRGFGAAYLLTASPSGQIKVLSVAPRLDGALLMMAEPSGGTAANLANNPTATLVFAPPNPDDLTLIIDGVGRALAMGFEFTPQQAILHRPAPQVK
jgi:hypothetical protein